MMSLFVVSQNRGSSKVIGRVYLLPAAAAYHAHAIAWNYDAKLGT